MENELKELAEKLAQESGLSIEVVRGAIRIEMARIGAAVCGPETANKYCESAGLPLRFEREGDKIAMSQLPLL